LYSAVSVFADGLDDTVTAGITFVADISSGVADCGFSASEQATSNINKGSNIPDLKSLGMILTFYLALMMKR
jgi:hypothetical protein